MSLLKAIQTIKLSLGPDVKLIAVTKKRSVREINQLIFLGVKDIGESQVQEAEEKKSLIKEQVNWHLIGHLQRNKIKQAVEIFDMIQSVDSYKLAKKINSVCKSKNKIMAVLVQVNIAKEPQKYGLMEEDVIPFLKSLFEFKNIKILGLMTIAPFIKPEETRTYFRKMKHLFNKIQKENVLGIEMKYLSMGMTNDYKVAIQEGSNMARIGTAIFREVQKPSS